MPDDCPRPAREAELRKRARLDLADGLYEFERGYGRSPRSWRDYRYGMNHLGRSSARHSLLAAEAGRMAQAAKQDDYTDWIEKQNLHAGW